MPEIIRSNPETIARAADTLRMGALVACPTDTVFGLLADARNPAAVAAIFAAKGRSADKSLPVLVANLAEAEEIAEFNDAANNAARRLTDAFWPGSLTIVLPLLDDANLAAPVTAGKPTVALRIPGHPVTLSLLKAFEGPLAVTSANVSGDPSALTASEASASLGENVALVLDANTDFGHSPSGTESTIVSIENQGVEENCIRVLRQGDIAAEDLSRVSGLPLADE